MVGVGVPLSGGWWVSFFSKILIMVIVKKNVFHSTIMNPLCLVPPPRAMMFLFFPLCGRFSVFLDAHRTARALGEE